MAHVVVRRVFFRMDRRVGCEYDEGENNTLSLS